MTIQATWNWCIYAKIAGKLSFPFPLQKLVLLPQSVHPINKCNLRQSSLTELQPENTPPGEMHLVPPDVFHYTKETREFILLSGRFT